MADSVLSSQDQRLIMVLRHDARLTAEKAATVASLCWRPPSSAPAKPCCEPCGSL